MTRSTVAGPFNAVDIIDNKNQLLGQLESFLCALSCMLRSRLLCAAEEVGIVTTATLRLVLPRSEVVEGPRST